MRIPISSREKSAYIQPNEKFILDATAGFRMMWFNKNHPNTIYLDERPECEPDIVGDFRDLSQFKDETFKLIAFDPPHIVRGSPNRDTNIQRQYGVLKPETWQSDISRGAKELWRILKPFGILLFKWNTQYLPSNEVIALFPTKPLFYQVSATSDKSSGKNRREKVKTVWFCFMKIPDD